jgi:DNA-binding NarL/FixJ family response regulator
MATIIVIDDDPAIAFCVRAAAPLYIVLDAPDGLRGLDLVRANLDAVELIVLDMAMPHFDGYDTVMQLRALRPARPLRILPFTGQVEAIPYLAELGCAPVLHKGCSIAQLGVAIAQVLAAPVPSLSWSAVQARYQRDIAAKEATLRRQERTVPVAILCGHPVGRQMLATMLGAVGAQVLLQASHPMGLRADQHALQRVAVLVGYGAQAAELISLAQAQQRGVVLLVLALQDMLAVYATNSVDLPLGVVVIKAEARALGAANTANGINTAEIGHALDAVRRGDNYRSPELAAPLTGSSLTNREQEVMLLELQGADPATIAARLNLSQPTVYSYRTSAYAKLGVANSAQLRVWAEAWWQQRTSGKAC